MKHNNHSTAPRTPEGKQRSSLTGQIEYRTQAKPPSRKPPGTFRAPVRNPSLFNHCRIVPPAPACQEQSTGKD